jgi:GNAT superfamily N-acetyltransferase
MTLVRPATHDDTPELVRLRALLFHSLDSENFVAGDWQAALTATLHEHLDSPTMRILVVAGDNGLAACGVGTIEQRLPGPRLPNGRLGQVFGVVTDPGHRRRGHSRAVMLGLLDWFREQGAGRVDLNASKEGAPLYRDLGFVDHHEPPMWLWL